MLVGEFIHERTGETTYQAVVLYQNLHVIYQHYGHIVSDLSLMSNKTATFKSVKCSQLLTVADIPSGPEPSVGELLCSNVRQESGIYSAESSGENYRFSDSSVRRKGPKPGN
mgnify:CR=1 FL=1